MHKRADGTLYTSHVRHQCITVRPSVCALLEIFLYTLKRLSSSLIYKELMYFNI